MMGSRDTAKLANPIVLNGLPSVTRNRSFFASPDFSVRDLLSIARLRGGHKNAAHNKSYAKFNDFSNAAPTRRGPKNWRLYCDSVSGNFRVVNPADFRVIKA